MPFTIKGCDLHLKNKGCESFGSYKCCFHCDIKNEYKCTICVRENSNNCPHLLKDWTRFNIGDKIFVSRTRLDKSPGKAIHWNEPAQEILGKVLTIVDHRPGIYKVEQGVWFPEEFIEYPYTPEGVNIAINVHQIKKGMFNLMEASAINKTIFDATTLLVDKENNVICGQVMPGWFLVEEITYPIESIIEKIEEAKPLEFDSPLQNQLFPLFERKRKDLESKRKKAVGGEKTIIEKELKSLYNNFKDLGKLHDSLKQNKHVRDIKFNGEVFELETNPLILEEVTKKGSKSKWIKELGSFKFRVARGGDVKIVHVDGPYFCRTHFHPHVSCRTDKGINESSAICLGGFRNEIIKAWETMDVGQLTLLGVQFLTTYNPGDNYMGQMLRSYDKCPKCKNKDFLLDGGTICGDCKFGKRKN